MWPNTLEQNQRTDARDEGAVGDSHPDTQRTLDELLRILLDEEV